jgi:hypothetical protein
MKTFKQYIQEDGSEREERQARNKKELDELIEMLKKCKHVFKNPTYRGYKTGTTLVVEKTPRTLNDGQGRKARDTEPDLNNAFNIAMEVYDETRPFFRREAFNTVDDPYIAHNYGGVYYVVFNSDFDAFRTKTKFPDSGEISIDGQLEEYLTTPAIKKKIASLDIYDEEFSEKLRRIRSRTPHSAIHTILKNARTLDEYKKAIVELDDPRVTEALAMGFIDELYSNCINYETFSSSTFDSRSIKSATLNKEIFIYNCSKYTLINTHKLFGLMLASGTMTSDDLNYGKVWAKVYELVNA